MAQKSAKNYPPTFQLKKGQISQEAEEKETTSRVFFPVWFFTQTKKKKEARSKSKRSEGEDSLVRLRLHHLLICRALRVRKKTKKHQFKWDLPSEVASNTNTQLEKYIQGKSLLDAICEVRPVPNTFNQVKKMDKFLKDLMKEKNKNNSLAIHEVLGNKQKSLIQSMVKVGECQKV